MKDVLLYSSLLLLIVLLAFKLYLQTRRQTQHLPPSPPSLPVLGHLHLAKKPLHRTFQTLSQRYDQIFSLRFGTRFVVVVSSPSAVEECFKKNDVVLANRPELLATKHLAYNHTTVAASPYGDHWRNLRRICALEIFSTNRLDMFSGARRDEVTRFLRKLSSNSSQVFAQVEQKSLFTDLAFSTIMRMVAGKRYYGYGEDVKDEEEARQFKDIMREAFESGGASNP